MRARTWFVGAIGAAAGQLLLAAIVPSMASTLFWRLTVVTIVVVLLVAAERSGFGRGYADADLQLEPGDRSIAVGDVVQLAPDEPIFGSCLMVVTDVTPLFMVTGYVLAPTPRGSRATPAAYYYKVYVRQVRRVGRAFWTHDPLRQVDAG